MLDWRKQLQSAHLSGINAAWRGLHFCSWGVILLMKSEGSVRNSITTQSIRAVLWTGTGRSRKTRQKLLFTQNVVLFYCFFQPPIFQPAISKVFAFSGGKLSFPNLAESFYFRVIQFHQTVWKNNRTDGRDRWDDRQQWIWSHAMNE